jgi:hypothetical protein
VQTPTSRLDLGLVLDARFAWRWLVDGAWDNQGAMAVVVVVVVVVLVHVVYSISLFWFNNKEALARQLLHVQWRGRRQIQ